MAFIICRNCTLLQRQEDIPYEINFNFEGRQFELDYYPVFLAQKNYDCVNENSCIFFSLKSLTYLVQSCGYKVTDAVVSGDKLVVGFDILNRLERIQVNEQKMRLDNQFTYFLASCRMKR